MHEDSYDCIVSAIGQSSRYEFIPADLLERMQSRWGKLLPGEFQQTALEKVFVGGDIANDTADAISAIEDGHHAARGIERFFAGRLNTATATEQDTAS